MEMKLDWIRWKTILRSWYSDHTGRNLGSRSLSERDKGPLTHDHRKTMNYGQSSHKRQNNALSLCNNVIKAADQCLWVSENPIFNERLDQETVHSETLQNLRNLLSPCIHTKMQSTIGALNDILT